MCRVTIRAPERILDLAVPADIPLADLLPVVVAQAGEQLEEAGLEHGGWVLQRIGGAPLDGELTLDAHDLRDGEVLLLRPETEALPPVRHDNLVDAVAGTVRELPHAWTPEISRWTLRLMTGAALLACLVVLALPGDPVSRAALAAGAALLALAGAGAAARVMEDPPGAVVLGLGAGLLLGLAGVLLTGDPWTAPGDPAGPAHTCWRARRPPGSAPPWPCPWSPSTSSSSPPPSWCAPPASWAVC
ncbi:hypothetical protein ACE1SV_72840 [Streptomyces sp. E-15]